MGKKRRAPGQGSRPYLRKRDKRWACYVTVHLPDGTPKRKWFYSKRGGTSNEVAAMQREYLVQYGQGVPLEAESLTLGEFLGEWLDSLEVKESSWERYAQEARLRIAPALGSVPLSKLKRGHVESFKRSLVGEYANDSVALTITVLKMALRRAVEWELIEKSPAEFVQGVRVAEDRGVAFSQEEVAKLVAVVEGTKFEARYRLLAKLGLRFSEMAALKWEDLDLEKRHLKIRTSKTGKGRTVTLPFSLIEPLKRHKMLQNEEHMAKRMKWQDEDLVFPNERGGLLAGSTAWRQLHRHLEAAGLPRIRTHDLRHTAVTLAIQQGLPLNAIAKMAGHANATMILKRYAHVLADMEEQAASMLDKYAF